MTTTSNASVASPLAAVTVTVTVFSPATNSALPSTTNEAKGSVVTATTDAARVPAGKVTAPPIASWPPTVRDSREVIALRATLKKSRFVLTDVSWAVTFTFTTFLPGTSASAPIISTLERIEFASAVISTEVTPFSRSNESPFAMSFPSYWNRIKLVSSFARTFRVTV